MKEESGVEASGVEASGVSGADGEDDPPENTKGDETALIYDCGISGVTGSISYD